MQYKMRDLPVEERGFVDRLIGRHLTEDEAFIINPVPVWKDEVGGGGAVAAVDQLEEYFAEIDRQHPPISPEEAEAAVDEAMRHVRPGYTAVR